MSALIAVLAAIGLSNVVDYGAKDGGDVVNTVAIQRTIDACARAGGGWVIVPRGVYRTGALFFKPGVKLRLDEGAVLLGSDDEADYPKCATGLEVFAGPVEGTAIGNLIVQMIAGGEFKDIAEARKAIVR